MGGKRVVPPPIDRYLCQTATVRHAIGYCAVPASGEGSVTSYDSLAGPRHSPSSRASGARQPHVGYAPTARWVPVDRTSGTCPSHVGYAPIGCQARANHTSGTRQPHVRYAPAARRSRANRSPVTCQSRPSASPPPAFASASMTRSTSFSKWSRTSAGQDATSERKRS